MEKLGDLVNNLNTPPHNMGSHDFSTMINYIKDALAKELDELDPIENNSFNRMCLQDDVNQFMQAMEDRDLVSDFEVICDETNNHNDRSQLNVDIRLHPCRSNEFVELKMSLDTSTLSDTSVNQAIRNHDANMKAAIESMSLEMCNSIDAEIIGELVRWNDAIDDNNFDRAMEGI